METGTPAEAPEATGARPLDKLPKGLRAVCRVLRDPALLAGADLALGDFRGIDLREVDFSGRDLTGARFDNALLRQVSFRGAVLDGAVFHGARLVDCDLSGCRAHGAALDRVLARRCRFDGASLRGCSLRRSRLPEVGFHGADLAGADLRETDFRRARVAGARLDGARAAESHWAGVHLEAADLGRVDLREVTGISLDDRRRLLGAGVLVSYGWLARSLARIPPRARIPASVAAALAVPVALALYFALPAVEPQRARPPGAAPAATSPSGPDPAVRVTQTPRNLTAPAFLFGEDGSFESTSLKAWAAEGPALSDQPICRAVGDTLPPAPDGVDGRCWINSEQTRAVEGERARSKGDDATGTLTSGPFRIEPGTLTMRVGGGRGPNTRVELLADGEVVREVSGADEPRLAEARWDLTPWAGKEGRLCIVDQFSGSWGRVMVDDIRFEPAAPEAPAPPARPGR